MKTKTTIKLYKKMRFSKKATEFGAAILVLFTLLLFLWASYNLYKKVNEIYPIGSIQYKLINTYSNGEKVLHYVDESAKYASYNALNSLADKGGVYNSECGYYFGASLLANQTKNCLPEDNDARISFDTYFIESLKDYLDEFKTYNLNSQYSLFTDRYQHTVSGIAGDKIVLPIGETKIEQMTVAQEYFATPGNYFGSPSKSNYITSCFGYRSFDQNGKHTEGYHEGLDFSISQSNEVYAVADGVVEYSDIDQILNNINCNCWGRVVINHGDGLRTTYLHLDTIAVSKGAIKKGGKIGVAGARGGSKGRYGYPPAHIHIEVTSDKISSLIKDPATGANIDSFHDYTSPKRYSINPACFFDLSQFKVADDSLACTQIDKTIKAKNKDEATRKFCELYKQMGITLPDGAAAQTNVQDPNAINNQNSQTQSLAANQQTQQQAVVSLSSGAVSCQNADFGKISKTDLSKCYKYYEIFVKYIKENKLDVDPLLIMSLVFTESTCMNADELRASGSKVADGGIMQVDEACLKQKKCQTIDSQIKEGMKVFASKLESIEKEGKDLSDNEKLTLLLYSYNRGSVDKIIDYYKTGNFKLDAAIFKGCTETYSGPLGSDTARYTSKLPIKDKCNSDGMGVQYPQKIYGIYGKACQAMGGTVSGGTGGVLGQAYDYSSQSAVYSSVGEYSFTPAFKIKMDYDLFMYKRIYDALFDLNKKYEGSSEKEEFMDNILANAKESDSTLLWSDDCDNPDEKAFYSFAESYKLCAESNDNDCYCEINFPKTIGSETFDISSNATNGKTTFKKQNKNDEEIIGAVLGKIGFPLNSPEFYTSTNVNIKKSGAGYSLSLTPVDASGKIFEKNYGSLIFSQPFIMYKSKNAGGKSFISFIDPSMFSSNSGYEDAAKDFENAKQNKGTHPICKVNKDTVKLCVNTSSKVPVYDNIKNTVEYKDSIIRFAFVFKDIIPPPIVSQINQGTSLLSEKKAIIRWQHEDIDDDTEKFVVFMSKEDLTGYTYKVLEELSETGGLPNPIEKNEFLISKSEKILSIDLEKPELKMSGANNKFEVLYKYDNGEMLLQSGTLYQIKINSDIDEYFSSVNFTSDGEYSVIIAALDKYGNVKMKNDNGVNTNLFRADIKDTLPPATQPLEDFKFTVTANNAENKVTLSFLNPPTLNIDDSKFDADKELKNYEIYYIQGKMTPENFFSLTPITIDTGVKSKIIENIDLSNGKEWCFYVVPVDINNNRQFDEKKTKQFMNNKNGKFFEPFCITGKASP